jgi:hypothetical protein
VLPPVEHPVWGVDPSTRRIALAIVIPAGGVEYRTLELGPGSVDAPKLAHARACMAGWFDSLAQEFDPGSLWVEQPFGGSKSSQTVPKQSQWMLAIVMEAAYAATDAVANLLTPTEWKAKAGLGGAARKRAILDWARAVHGLELDCDRCGPDGRCKGGLAHDVADAHGIAVAGAAFAGRDLSAASWTVDT